MTMNQSNAITIGDTYHGSVQFLIFVKLMVSVFIAEGGQKCLTDKREGLRDCFNKSMKNIIPNDFSLENLPLLKIGETECKGCATLQHCLVKELETCKDKTTANLMETLFKFIRNTLACSIEQQALAVGDGGPPFIAESGQECLTDKREVLQDCFYKSMKNIIPNDFSPVNLPPLLKIRESECKEFTTLQRCLAKELETCQDNIPANLTDTLFLFIRKTLPCSTERHVLIAAGDSGPHKFGSDRERYLSSYIRDKRQLNLVDEKLNANEDSLISLTQELQTKCDRNSLIPGAFQVANSTLFDIVHCIRVSLMGTAYTCESKKVIVENYLDKFLADLKHCLIKKEEFFIQFLRDAVHSALNYLCEEKGWRFSHFRSSTGIQCFDNTRMNPLRECFKSIEKTKVENGEVILEKSNVCKSLQTTDDCMTKFMKDSCSDSKSLRDVLHGSLQALRSPCSGSSIFLSNALLFALILFYFRKLWY